MARLAFVPILLAAAASGVAAGAADSFPLTGTIVNAVTGEPVRRASVGIQFLGGESPGILTQTVTADAGGRFEFANLSAGKYLIWAERRGYARKNSTEEVKVDGGGVTLRMTPYSVVTGKVVDENGDPIIGANIQALQSVIAGGQRVIQPAHSGTTNDLGEYRLSQLAPGRYYVSAWAGKRQDAHYGRLYYAGAPEFSSATPLELAAGADARADFRMEPIQTFAIRGRILDQAPGTNAAMTLSPRDSAEAFSGAGYTLRMGPETGQFEFLDVSPGRYTLSAVSLQGGDRANATQEVTVGKTDLEGLTLPLKKAVQLAGNVRVQQKEGGLALDPNRVGIVLRPKEAGLRPQPSARLLPDKSFEIPEVFPGDYVLLVSIPEPYYLQSALWGGLDALATGISISTGDTLAPLTIEIGSNGGKVEGTVLKGDKPAANCSVLLVRSSSSAAQEKIASTDAVGHFMLNAVAPGDYTAYAWDNVNEIEYHNPEVLQRYWGEHVAVQEGGKTSVQLKWNAQF